MTSGTATLTIPPGALDAPVEITITPLAEAPWGTVGPAYDLGPDGLAFRVPATLAMTWDPDALPPGVTEELLRVSVHERGRWVPVAGGGRRSGESVAAAELHHLSIYGLAPLGDEGTAFGRSLSVNGVTVETSEDAFVRLRVTPTMVHVGLARGDDVPVDVTLSGLPSDADHHLFLGSYRDSRVIRPEDGGRVTVTTPLEDPRVLWVQPGPATWIVSSDPAVDQCGMIGVRTGSVCTLTGDVVGAVEIEGEDQTLDCAGHRVVQDPVKPGTGVGIAVGSPWARIGAPPPVDVTVRNCVVGGPGTDAFSVGLQGWGIQGLTVEDCVFDANHSGIIVGSGAGATIVGNTVTGASEYGIAVQGPSLSNEISNNRVSVDPWNFAHPAGLRLSGGMRKGAAMGGDPARDPVTDTRLVGNVVEEAQYGVSLGEATGNEVSGNDLSARRGIFLAGPDAWPNRVFHNNVVAATLGVEATFGPVELSDGGRGNWWGRSCPGPLYVPGVDSNRVDVVDSRAYGTRNGWMLGGVPGCLADDSDGDTVPDALDNCPDVPNPGQENSDGIGEPDACDFVPPPAPVIVSPVDGAILAVADFEVRGIAEPFSTVTAFVFEEPALVAVSDEEGVFRGVPVGPFPDGSVALWAVARDAAGHSSPRSATVVVEIDATPPAPPVILRPEAGQTVNTTTPAVEGIAADGTRVEVREGATRLADCPIAGDGSWFCRPLVAMVQGEHTVTAVAIDRAGRSSDASIPVAFAVRAPSPTAPARSDRGKLEVTALQDSPDPFHLRREVVDLSTDVRIDPVGGLAGRSPNHEFHLRAVWSIRDALAAREVRRLVAAVPLAAGAAPAAAPIRVTATATWDGADGSGEAAQAWRVHPYDLEVAVVRTYTGPGAGPPCGSDERPVPAGSGRGACLIDRLRIVGAGTLLPIDESSLLADRVPRWSPGGKRIFDPSEPPATLLDARDATAWMSQHAEELRTAAHLGNASTFHYRTVIDDPEYRQHIFEHRYAGHEVSGDVVEVVAPKAGARSGNGVPDHLLPVDAAEVRFRLTPPVGQLLPLPPAVARVAAAHGVPYSAVLAYYYADRSRNAAVPRYRIPLDGSPGILVNDRGELLHDARIPQASPPADPVLRQRATYHGPDDPRTPVTRLLPMPFTHVWDGAPTLPADRFPRPGMPAEPETPPLVTTDRSAAFDVSPELLPRLYAAPYGADWIETCSVEEADIYPVLVIDPSNAESTTMTSIDKFQPRMSRGLAIAGASFVDFAASPSFPDLATTQVYFALTNVTHAYRAVGMDTPATFGSDPIPFCIIRAPSGLLYDYRQDPVHMAGGISQARNVRSCLTDADCRACIEYKEPGDWRCAADVREGCTPAGGTAVECHNPIAEVPGRTFGRFAECDMSVAGLPRDEAPGAPTGVCRLFKHTGGLAWWWGIEWGIGHFYQHDRTPRSPSGWVDTQGNPGHEAQHKLSGLGWIRDRASSVNALESGQGDAYTGGVVTYAALDEARGVFPSAILARHRIDDWGNRLPGRDRVYGGSCEAEEGTREVRPGRCEWDDERDDFECTYLCTATDPSGRVAPHRHCAWSPTPVDWCEAEGGAPGCRCLPSEYAIMWLLDDILQEYADAVGGWHGMADGLRAWRLNQADSTTKWVLANHNSYYEFLMDADWHGDRHALAARAFHPHIRRIAITRFDDLPGKMVNADPIGYPTIGRPLWPTYVASSRDWEQFSFFAEAGVPMRIEVEEPHGTDMAFCIDGALCGQGHPAGAGEAVDFVPDHTGWHWMTVVPESRGRLPSHGPYYVKIARAEPDFPDSQEAAWPLDLSGETWVGDQVDVVMLRRDVDWFRFWVNAVVPGTTVVVSLRDGDGPGVPRAEVRSADGARIVPLVVGDNTLTFTTADRGWWFVRVDAAGVGPFTEYSLRVRTAERIGRSLCPATPSSPRPGIPHGDDPCYLGEGLGQVVAADLADSDEVDTYLLCLERNQPASVFLADGTRKLRLELRPIPGGRYQVVDDGFFIMSAQDGNVSSRGPVLHFTSPDAQCYRLSVRASYGEDKVRNDDPRRNLWNDDDVFRTPAPYALHVHAGDGVWVRDLPNLFPE